MMIIMASGSVVTAFVPFIQIPSSVTIKPLSCITGINVNSNEAAVNCQLKSLLDGRIV